MGIGLSGGGMRCCEQHDESRQPDCFVFHFNTGY
jgi:hypothetical protein